MKDDRDSNIEWKGHFGEPVRAVFKGTNLPVPEEKKSKSGFRYYDSPGVCALCGSYTCEENCFK